MYKIITFLVFSLILTQVLSECTERVCCDISCTACGPCVGNQTIDVLCCENTILNSGMPCDYYHPPCYMEIIDSGGSSIFIWSMLIIGIVVCFVTGIFIIIGLVEIIRLSIRYYKC